MKRVGIGEFEELVLLTICVLENDAYALDIKDEVENRTNRRMNISAIHTTLYRMEDKGLLQSKLGEASQVRGGKRKRLFSVTSFGLKSLAEVHETRSRLWSDIPANILKSLHI
ncbi:MAG: helix-turn-helix transcriptional regulator [Roseivirga sp.]|uniref:PadR family transcriptional regulator n=1 Tax=Roseivirga sp. TaxID=1964215 RepID=UPI001B018590|nr:helix-turn-helix transcriptional regulator [Roseivirga sp.]MBO6660120.1 helix-turn-helix transcriptional regulator [Roseivirga sp.]MBO6762290.1 helix-turn-helix transcriptional regulator [Roseivirga sp.]MBO6907143.1 helix-turn-helix transcriptional regulator [Roseivirga sp.]